MFIAISGKHLVYQLLIKPRWSIEKSCCINLNLNMYQFPIASPEFNHTNKVNLIVFINVQKYITLRSYILKIISKIFGILSCFF